MFTVITLKVKISRISSQGGKTMGEETRFVGLKRRLQELRYDHPLGLESAPLVESLVTDLGHANERIDTLQAQLDEQAHSLIVAENQSHPLRKENGRLLRENNQLHLELIKKAEAAEKEVKEQQALSVRLQKQNTDLSFISAQHVQQIRTLEEANAGLRDRFNEALQQNGVVLVRSPFVAPWAGGVSVDGRVGAYRRCVCFV